VPKMTLSGLIGRRAAVVAELEAARDSVVELTASLRVLDARIGRLRVNSDVSVNKPRALALPSGGRQRGPIVRPLLTVLRTALEPITLRAITLRQREPSVPMKMRHRPPGNLDLRERAGVRG
jgi:hypothetical protein